MQVNYRTLKDQHYILQNKDTLTLHGVNYQVNASVERFFLNNTDGPNNKVFKVFGMDDTAKHDWAKLYNSTCCGDFPEFKNAADLTKFVIAIYEKCPFKVGDKVRPVHREYDVDDYPWSYTEEMTDKYEGDILTIGQIETTTCECEDRLFNGDPHKYYLNDGDEDTGFIWHSSMFTKVGDAETSSKIDKPEADYDIDKLPDQTIPKEGQIVIYGGYSSKKIQTIINLV